MTGRTTVRIAVRSGRRSRAARAITGGRGSAPPGRVWLALAGFAVVCGLGLLLFGGSTGGAAPSPPRDLTQEAIEHARAAERALADENYGSAKDHLMATQEIPGKAATER